MPRASSFSANILETLKFFSFQQVFLLITQIIKHSVRKVTCDGFNNLK